jgi:hypothetical protein
MRAEKNDKSEDFEGEAHGTLDTIWRPECKGWRRLRPAGQALQMTRRSAGRYEA